MLGNGQPVHAQWFIEDFQFTTPVVTDPELKSHAITGAKRVSKIPDPRMFVAATRAFVQGNRQTKTMGHAGMLGGVFVITPDGEMPFSYISQYAGDHPDPEAPVRILEGLADRGASATREVNKSL